MMIFVISNLHPDPKCICDVKDYGTVAGTLTQVEITPLIAPNVTLTLNYLGGPINIPTNTSSTSNSAKFGIGPPAPRRAANVLFYKPVFTGPTARLTGSAEGAVTLFSNDPTVLELTIEYDVAWSGDAISWFILSGGSLDIASVIPGSGNFTLPYAHSFTPAEIALGGAAGVMIGIRYRIVSPTLDPVAFFVRSIVILGTEL